MIRTGPDLRAFALGLNLPKVTRATPWGHAALKAHGNLWGDGSAHEDAAVVMAGHEEGEMRMQADRLTFFLHAHAAPHALISVRAGQIDPA